MRIKQSVGVRIELTNLMLEILHAVKRKVFVRYLIECLLEKNVLYYSGLVHLSRARTPQETLRS